MALVVNQSAGDSANHRICRYPQLRAQPLGIAAQQRIGIETIVYDCDPVGLHAVHQQRLSNGGGYRHHAIGQMDVVHPFNRPQKDWMVRFSLTQGF